MKFKKYFISASLAVYLFDLAVKDEEEIINIRGSFATRLPKCLHDEFIFVVKNITKKSYGDNKKWGDYIKSLELTTKIKDLDFDYYTSWIVEVIFEEYKLYETKSYVYQYLKLI